MHIFRFKNQVIYLPTEKSIWNYIVDDDLYFNFDAELQILIISNQIYRFTGYFIIKDKKANINLSKKLQKFIYDDDIISLEVKNNLINFSCFLPEQIKFEITNTPLKENNENNSNILYLAPEKIKKTILLSKSKVEMQINNVIESGCISDVNSDIDKIEKKTETEITVIESILSNFYKNGNYSILIKFGDNHEAQKYLGNLSENKNEINFDIEKKMYITIEPNTKFQTDLIMTNGRNTVSIWCQLSKYMTEYGKKKLENLDFKPDSIFVGEAKSFFNFHIAIDQLKTRILFLKKICKRQEPIFGFLFFKTELKEISIEEINDIKKIEDEFTCTIFPVFINEEFLGIEYSDFINDFQDVKLEVIEKTQDKLIYYQNKVKNLTENFKKTEDIMKKFSNLSKLN